MTIENLIQEIANIDYSKSTSYEEAFGIFNSVTGIQTYSSSLKSGSTLYRSRTNPSFQQFTNYFQLSYPPSNAISEFSRANRPNQSFLYTSDSPTTNYAELLPSWSKMDLLIGDSIWVTTAEFRCIKDFEVTVIPDFNNEKMSPFIKKSSPTDLEKEVFEGINKIIRKNTLDDPYVYIKSSAFFNTLRVFLRSFEPSSSGFIYTSVQNQDQVDKGWNLVIDPSIADNNLELVNVFKLNFKLIDIANGKPSFTHSEPLKAQELRNETQEIVWK